MDKKKVRYETNKIIKNLYKVSQPYTSHKFSDDAWENVHKFMEALSNIDGIEDFVYGGGKYYKHNEAEYKEYSIEILTIYHTYINGIIRCHFCGTMENPHSAYDITVSFYEDKEIKENNNMENKLIKLTESELHDIIKETINSILCEIGETAKGQYALGAVRGRALGRTLYQSKYQVPSKRNKQGETMEDAYEKAWQHRHNIQDPKQVEDMANEYKKGFDYGLKKAMK